MSLATSIFLSVATACLTALYITTKDRWNWSKIMTRFIPGLITAVLLVGGIYYAWRWWSNRPKILDSLWDISLSSTRDDILFIKGPPMNYEDKDYDKRMIYQDGGDHYTIRFTTDSKIWYIWFSRSPPKFKFAPPLRLNAVAVIEFLGDPSEIITSPDSFYRTYYYPKYHVFYEFFRNNKSSYGVYNPKYGSPKWEYPKRS